MSILSKVNIAFAIDPLALLGSGIAGGATIALAIRLWPTSRPAVKAKATDPLPLETKPQWPEATLPIQTFETLLHNTGTASFIDQARQGCGLNEATWSNFILPVVRNVAELVQLLPASESHHHAQPGGLWIHTCETLCYAIRLRQGTILPSGRDAEDQSRHRHRWTAGVIIAALLHDVGKTIKDLRVRLYSPHHRGSPWNALTGDMLATQATDYAVDFPKAGERDYQAHQRDGILLLERLVPSPTLIWIDEDPPLLDALMQYLSGEAVGTDNPIAVLVSRAEIESVRLNLLDGPRTRFSTARAIPLIERLMDALRRMLAEGGRLPLNRPGAAGFVYQGDIWFAAARVANSVRDYLRENESAIGVPGEDKNDRLFDVWQDYGACRTNPTNGRALWSGRLDFTNGAGYDLPAMLRFPLERLYPDPSQYPAEIDGQIQALSALFQVTTPAAPVISIVATAASVFDANAAAVDTRPEDEAVSDHSHSVAKVPDMSSVANSPPAPPNEFLDAEDAASRSDLSAPSKPSATLQPVAPAMPLPVIANKAGKPAAGPSREALEFMAWVQKGIADASLPYNAAGALVHFVRYKQETGMLFVSPLIFRRFAEARGEVHPPDVMPGLSVQRAVTAAGWHLRVGGGKNVVSYQVMRKGERGGSLLNGFLVLQPERFFNPVPQTNDRLIFWNTEPARKDQVSSA